MRFGNMGASRTYGPCDDISVEVSSDIHQLIWAFGFPAEGAGVIDIPSRVEGYFSPRCIEQFS